MAGWIQEKIPGGVVNQSYPWESAVHHGRASCWPFLFGFRLASDKHAAPMKPLVFYGNEEKTN